MANGRLSNNARGSLKLFGLAVGMFAFAVWVMPPLYDAFCDITGLNGKTRGPYVAESADVDSSREVTVQFIATNNENMPWEFKPVVKSMKVHPGQETEAHFFVHNTTAHDMTAQAIPSLVPYKAVDYFHKTECFCFHSQPLAAGETAELPLRFIVDQSIPAQVHTITLSYTLFDITKTNSEAGDDSAPPLAIN